MDQNYVIGTVGYTIGNIKGNDYLVLIDDFCKKKKEKEYLRKVLNKNVDKFYWDYSFVENESSNFSELSLYTSSAAIMLACMNYARFFDESVFVQYAALFLSFFILFNWFYGATIGNTDYRISINHFIYSILTNKI